MGMAPGRGTALHTLAGTRAPVRSTTAVRAVAMCLVALLFASVAAGCADDTVDSSSPSTTSGEQTASLLISLSAEGGTWGEADSDGTRLLTLRATDPHTIAFADRPSRLAFAASTADLVDRWDAIFGDDPPNAVLVGHEPAAAQASTVITLAAPQYDAATRELRFTTTILLEAEQPEALDGVGGERVADPPASFEAASLFIDNIGPYPSQYSSRYTGMPCPGGTGPQCSGVHSDPTTTTSVVPGG